MVVGRTWPSTTNRLAVAAVAVRHEQQQVGEAEVGEQAPPGHQALEVADARPSSAVWKRASSVRVAMAEAR